MSKKHYILLAKIISECLYSIRNMDIFFLFIERLCDALRKDNDKFDSMIFREACMKFEPKEKV